jgi:hypothetical protein
MQKWRNPKVSVPMYHLLNVHEDFSYYFELGLVSWFQTQPRQGLHNGLRRGGLTKHAATGLRRGGCSIYRRWMQKRWCTFVLSRSKWPRILLGKFVTVFSEWMMSLFNLRFVSRNSCIPVESQLLPCRSRQIVSMLYQWINAFLNCTPLPFISNLFTPCFLLTLFLL